MNIYTFQADDAHRFAQFLGIRTKSTGSELRFKYCPYCHSPKDQGTFAINLKTGAFNCKRASCGAKGNMLTLAKDFGFSLGRDVDAYIHQDRPFKNMRKYPRPKTKPKAVEYMETRGISREVTESYAITTQRDRDGVLVFPFFDEQSFLRTRSIRSSSAEKRIHSG